jgi:WD40 repeat protein
MKNKVSHKENKKEKSVSNEEPEIYAIKKSSDGISFSRKDFIGTLGTAGAAIALNPLFSGCKKEDDEAIHKSIMGIETQYWYAGFAFSNDGQFLATYGSAESSVHLWSIQEKKHLKTLENVEKYPGIKGVEFSPDGQFLIINTYTTLNIWSIPGGTLINQLAYDGDFDYYQVTEFSISSDSKYVAYNKYPEYSIRICSIPDGTLLKTLDNCRGYENNFQLSPDSNFLVSGYENRLLIYSFPEGELIRSIDTGTASVIFRFSPDGKFIATREASQAGIIKLWSFPEGDLRNTILASEDQFYYSFHQDGKILVTWGPSCTNAIWSVPDGTLLYSLAPNSENLRSLCFCPDSNIMAEGYADTILLLSLDSQGIQLLSPTIYENVDNDSLYKVLGFSPDGKVLASAYGKKINLWSIPDCEPIKTDACICNKVCTCDTVTNNNTDDVCTCNTVESCTCNAICTCNAVVSCSCDNNSGGGGGYYTYWYPN